MLDRPPSPDDADNPLRTVYMGPLLRAKEFAERFGVSLYTAYGMSEVPVPIVSGARPGGRAQLRPRRGSRALRAAARRRARHPGPGGHARRADRAPLAAVDDQLRLQEHARGDRERVAQRLVPHGRPVRAGRGRQLLLPRPDEGRDPPARREHLVVRGRGGGRSAIRSSRTWRRSPSRTRAWTRTWRTRR